MEAEEEGIQVREGKKEEKEGAQRDGEKVDAGLDRRSTLVGLEVDWEEAVCGGEGEYRKRDCERRG
jgi:hypothetical protein